jgi:uncharacterized protein (TIGR00730 family)
MSTPPAPISSVCVYCASSVGVDPEWRIAAGRLGAALAAADLRLIYGGGGVGLMGACASAAHAAGGRVLGVMPRFLIDRERTLGDVETVVVETMHERKIRMLDESDAFVVLPGAVGTLEEVVELISWRRLGLHAKPIVFYSPAGFWTPLFALFDHFIAARLVQSEFADCWRSVDDIDAVISTLRAIPRSTAPLPLHMGDVA